MIEIVTEELLKKIDNRFLLSIVAAKRARQLKDGAIAQITDAEGESELMVALGEIMSDKIRAEIVEEQAGDELEVIAAPRKSRK